MNKVLCANVPEPDAETFDCCPTCGVDAADDLDTMARRVKLNSDGKLIARCECGQLFKAVPEVIWKTEVVNEH